MSLCPLCLPCEDNRWTGRRTVSRSISGDNVLSIRVLQKETQHNTDKSICVLQASLSVFYRKKHNITQASLSVFYRNTTPHNKTLHRTTRSICVLQRETQHNTTLHRTAGSIWDDNQVHAAPPPVPTSPTPSYTLLTKHRAHLAFFTKHVFSNNFAKIGCFPAILETTQSFPPTESIGSPIISKIIWEPPAPLIHQVLRAELKRLMMVLPRLGRRWRASRDHRKSLFLPKLPPVHTSCRHRVCGTASTLLLLPRLSALLSNKHASTTKLLLSTFDSPESFCVWWCFFKYHFLWELRNTSSTPPLDP